MNKKELVQIAKLLGLATSGKTVKALEDSIEAKLAEMAQVIFPDSTDVVAPEKEEVQDLPHHEDMEIEDEEEEELEVQESKIHRGRHPITGKLIA